MRVGYVTDLAPFLTMGRLLPPKASKSLAYACLGTRVSRLCRDLIVVQDVSVLRAIAYDDCCRKRSRICPTR